MDIRTATADKVTAPGPIDGSNSPSNVALGKPDDVGGALGDGKKSKQKQARGKNNRQDEIPMQQKSSVSDEVNDLYAEKPRQNEAAAAAPDEISVLRWLVTSQLSAIRKLQSQLAYVLSFLVIDDTEINNEYITELENEASRIGPVADKAEKPPSEIMGLASDNTLGSDQELWSEVVSKRQRPHHANTFQQSVVAAVYMDQTGKNDGRTA